ncbi:MAG TPA: hypothetical protein DCP97_03805 [Ruminococcaceae bacterium]|nr:hypothetical protein [Oscillospiraceae bacterium]
MKQAEIIKSANSKADQNSLELINRFSRRALTADEVYVFSLILCDNETDRDNERFTIESLNKLKELFVGKTGIFDHNPKGHNQTARIFNTYIEQCAEKTIAAGEPYTCLKADAYMVKSEKTNELILEIDAGIKKEVSISCSVKRVLCSICGCDLKQKKCEHIPGKSYQTANGRQICCGLLTEPSDAYEFSFVAIPAQPNAGVTKGYAQRFENDGCIKLSREEYERINALARDGERYKAALQAEVLKLCAINQPHIDIKLMQKVTERMLTDELESFKKAFDLNQGCYAPQLYKCENAVLPNEQFKI